MAVLAPELVTQRTAKAVVPIQSDSQDDAAAEVMWASTTDLGASSVTLDKAVAEDQKDRDEVVERVDAAAAAAREQ